MSQKCNRQGSDGVMHEKITDIQNSFWKAYKGFLKHKNMDQYMDELCKIKEKYRHDPVMLRFYKNLACSWSPVMVAIQEEWYGGN